MRMDPPESRLAAGAEEKESPLAGAKEEIGVFAFCLLLCTERRPPALRARNTIERRDLRVFLSGMIPTAGAL